MLFTTTLFAQNEDTKAVSELTDKFFAGIKSKNNADIRAVFMMPEAQIVAIDKPRDGTGLSTKRVFTAESFAKLISESKPEYTETMPNKDVKISGDLAMVAGRYKFYIGDKFSHCGTNTFHLMRTETGWLIINAASTIEFQCDRDLQAVEIPKIAANPVDVSTIDSIIKAFYEVVSGAKGVPRQ